MVSKSKTKNQGKIYSSAGTTIPWFSNLSKMVLGGEKLPEIDTWFSFDIFDYAFSYYQVSGNAFGRSATDTFV